jgi:hypothetical protein
MQYADILEDLKEWATKEKLSHKSGVMMSMAESVQGEIFFSQLLEKIDELETYYE